MSTFVADDARFARMHGYAPVMTINLRPPRAPEPPRGWAAAWFHAWTRVRREVWTRREHTGQFTLGRPALYERGEVS